MTDFGANWASPEAGRNFQKCIQDNVIPWEEMKTLTICGIEPQKGNKPVKLHVYNGYTAEDFIAILKPKASTDKLEASMGNISYTVNVMDAQGNPQDRFQVGDTVYWELHAEQTYVNRRKWL